MSKRSYYPTNLTAIVCKYISPTNTRGARIKANAPFAGDTDRSITIAYPHNLSGADCYAKAAAALMDKFDWSGDLIAGSIGNDYVFIMLPGTFMDNRAKYSREIGGDTNA